MKTELLAIGSELVLGELVDTNSAHIARAVRTVGLEVSQVTLVGDDLPRIATLVAELAGRAQVVITTGGLGPTVDDPTREAVARAFGLELAYHPELWAQIEARFAKFGRVPGENNRRQAFVPLGAHIIENPVGTAPAFAVEHAGGVVVCLPGVPREMEHLLTQAVLPFLRQKFRLTGVVQTFTLRTIGIGESVIDERIGELEKQTNPSVGLNAHAGSVDVRLTVRAASEAEAEALLAPVRAQVYAALGEHIFGEGHTRVEEVVIGLLARHGHTVAVLEGGTGAALATRLAASAHGPNILRGLTPLEAPASLAALRAQAEAHRVATGVTWVVALSAQPDTRHMVLVVAGATHTETRESGYAGPPAMLGAWASTAALNVLWRLLKP